MAARETRYVDTEGRPIELPPAGTSRAVTFLGQDATVAALVHDPALLERRAVLEAAGAAARFALENERLQAELRAQVVELRESRARIVSAGDEERRRLERDLPAVLTEQGLAPAVMTLAVRSPVPVEVDELPEERLSPAVEATAYFVISEALANVAKHAGATAARVTASGELVAVEVADDGLGGAKLRGASGLAGLADRVHALAGSLSIESEPGLGTTLRAELPCVASSKVEANVG